MAGQAQYAELMRQFSAFGAVKRELGRMMPADCPSGSAAVLTLLQLHGDMRMSKLAELLAVDISVTSRHVAHLAERGWIQRSRDPADKRSRILHLTPAGLAQIDELSRRTTEMLARRLSDWNDDDVGHLIRLMSRLRADFDDGRCTPAARPATPPGAGPSPAASSAPATRTPAQASTRTPARAPTRTSTRTPEITT
ncbi:MarR family transcriptional regulator [Streptomyces sp. NPDC005925]|uniref:MarR family winged helix-turn-helix transcriptional regulator n=1 Tax=Streptomyces sp. NPDC005925 TaxID=3157172 RepID=UPI0033E8554D